ncbi:MAG TPA: nucleotide sugar dehydrogenase [Candidatus Mailhella merdavium]|nr:nucleotide sugar dehydrogenase [Candidatus Mailhella merdavium]
MTSMEALLAGQACVALVGLGYVGLPLAVGLARNMKIIGYDRSEERVNSLRSGTDWTGEVDGAELIGANLELTTDATRLAEADIIIVAVPTPIDEHRNPDLSPLEDASETVGANMKRGAVVVYESTVYPGVTEEICVPLLEKASGMSCGKDFSVGYSPERINPGDRVHTLKTVMKIVSGSDEATAALLEQVYGSVVSAGIHRAPSIRVAEAAKVIENTQRDLNIALMNELSLIFNLMGIDTQDVLDAAGTKWNFLHFQPGLVGGHCIGVDPYYLTYKAETLGYHPQVILSGRRINDSMGKYVAENCVKMLIREGRLVNGARVGVLGFTFKENIPDTRNTRVIDMVRELEEYGVTALVHDPHAAPEDVRRHYGLELHTLDELLDLDALILAVAHREFESLPPEEMLPLFREPEHAILIDVKGFYNRKAVAEAGIRLWRL